MTKLALHRRDFLRVTACAPMAAPLLGAAEPNIRWGLGLVTWRGKAEWPEILADVDAAGFDGVEPFTAKFLNDEAMAELEKLLPKYSRLRMSSIYWSGPFHTASEHEKLLQQSRQILGYLKRFGAERLTFGPPRADVDDEKAGIANTATVVTLATGATVVSGVDFGINFDVVVNRHPGVCLMRLVVKKLTAECDGDEKVGL